MPGSRVRVPPLLWSSQSFTGGWLDFLLGTVPRTVPISSHFSASSAAGEQIGWTSRGRAEYRVRPWQRARSGSALMLRHPMTGTAAERALGAAAGNVAGNSPEPLVARLTANCASRISERSRCVEGNRAACLVHRDDHTSPVSLIAGTTGQVNGDVAGGGPVDPPDV